jgi:hypothetical protein
MVLMIMAVQMNMQFFGVGLNRESSPSQDLGLFSSGEDNVAHNNEHAMDVEHALEGILPHPV